MRPPYGSIIIPTHDRASTLRYSIDSALKQTEPDVEVIVVGDGCSEGCREIARRWQASDARVRFLDLPKAPFLGAANRDRAIREARAPRIFYNDDDDLLLPEHVAVLGAALDDCDVVDTPAVSVSPNGAVHLSLHDSGNARQQALLIDDKLKMVFDTHLAHRKEAYLRIGGPWAHSEKRAVWNVLKAFARDESVVWRTIFRITALSFHGARRRTMRHEDRAAELKAWSAVIHEAGIERRLRATGGYAFHLLSLVSSLRNAGADAAEARTFVADLSQAAGDSAHQVLVRETLDVLMGEELPQGNGTAILADLIEGRLGVQYTTEVHVQRLVGMFGLERVAELLPTEGLAAFLARTKIEQLAGRPLAAARDQGHERLDGTPSADAFAFAFAMAAILAKRDGHARDAWTFTERAVPLAPSGPAARSFWLLRLALAQELGKTVEAAEAEDVVGLTA